MIHVSNRSLAAIVLGTILAYVAALLAMAVSAKYGQSWWYQIFGRSGYDIYLTGLAVPLFLCYGVTGAPIQQDAEGMLDSAKNERQGRYWIALMGIPLIVAIICGCLVYIDALVENGHHFHDWIVEAANVASAAGTQALITALFAAILVGLIEVVLIARRRRTH